MNLWCDTAVILSTSSFALGADTLGDFLESLCPVVERDLFSDSSFDDYDEFSYSSFAAALKLASDVKFSTWHMCLSTA